MAQGMFCGQDETLLDLFFLNWNLLAIILPIFDVVDGEKWKKYAWNYSCPTDRNF